MNLPEVIAWRKMRLQVFAQTLRELVDCVYADIARDDPGAYADEQMLDLARALITIVDGTLKDLTSPPE